MSEVAFYHLQRTPLARALPKLLERALERGMRALVVAGSKERVDDLDTALWTYDTASFLPHGRAGDGNPEDQPIWLAEHDANANGATLLVLVDGGESHRHAAFERVIDMFDGADADAVAAARRRWKALKEAGHKLTYWQQTERGGWEMKAES
jgi:DNA polymerase-3 subunit chi